MSFLFKVGKNNAYQKQLEEAHIINIKRAAEQAKKVLEDGVVIHQRVTANLDKVLEKYNNKFRVCSDEYEQLTIKTSTDPLKKKKRELDQIVVDINYLEQEIKKNIACVKKYEGFQQKWNKGCELFFAGLTEGINGNTQMKEGGKQLKEVYSDFLDEFSKDLNISDNAKVELLNEMQNNIESAIDYVSNHTGNVNNYSSSQRRC